MFHLLVRSLDVIAVERIATFEFQCVPNMRLWLLLLFRISYSFATVTALRL